MFKIVEYKIRKPDITRWEDTPIFKRKKLFGTKEKIKAEANEIAEGMAFLQKSEVRWNYQGLKQGHYIAEIFADEEIQIREERIALLHGKSGSNLLFMSDTST